MMLALILTCGTGSNWTSGKVLLEALILETPVQNHGFGGITFLRHVQFQLA